MNEATRRQIEAADPARSTWLSANAGSGKTRVLTDRVARLLLDGASPQNILCLTYTKAAASEMQNRLFGTLGGWAMIDDADLRARLTELGVSGAITDERLRQARVLFARAIETPGGLKIQTIHSFCAALLRRFPLEGGVSPQFVEMDDRAAALLRDECIEELAEGDAGRVIDGMAAHFTGDDFGSLTREILGKRDRFGTPLNRAALERSLELPAGYDAARLRGEVFLGGEEALIDRLIAQMRLGGKQDTGHAERLAAIPRPLDVESLPVLERLLLTGSGAKAPFSGKIGKFPTKDTRDEMPEDHAAIDSLIARVETARPLRQALATLERSTALHAYAAALLPLYERRKAARGWLDFDDLILKARDLLTDSAAAPWVLYKLDGGIDHILVDEAQDTAPAQWQVIEALAREFTAGEGTHTAGERTLFVVGDKKQSIYSFQGADPESFDTMRARFADQLAAQSELKHLELLHSFRSSSAILGAVDAVYGDGVAHLAFHEALPGRVDLWPIIEAEKEDEDPPWHDPVDRIAPTDANVQLASAIAREIRRMIDEKETIPAENGARRRVREGDFLILVQRRKVLFNEIIRACKRENLEIAGADRLSLSAELAVKDLVALLRFLATPEDDLSLASVLRSPLLGWSEAQLFDLAANRGGQYLWQALRDAPEVPDDTLTFLRDMRGQSDFLRPFELLDRCLVRHDSRTRLLARLGAEAEDGIDELLTQAMAYERTDVPSLTGFLAWLDAEDVEIKRQPDSAGNRIRVMTVHGAKGLESPIVILPETLRRLPASRDEVLIGGDGVAHWRPRTEDMPPALAEAKEAMADADAAERKRLLYVAMTRAETWLIVCGAGDPGKMGNTWYSSISDGLAELDTLSIETPERVLTRYARQDWSSGPVDDQPTEAPGHIALPDWVGTRAPPQAEEVGPLSPSDLGGAKALPGEGAMLDEEAARLRGTRIHLLLEHLTGVEPAMRPEIARFLLHDPANPLADAAREELVGEVAALLDDPDLRHCFGPDTMNEVEIAAPLDDGTTLLGVIDRLVVTPERVLAIDFKSNAVVPDTSDSVPEGLLRQMGAYATALTALYPDRPVETALLWTRTRALMPLPHDAVIAAFGRRGAA